MNYQHKEASFKLFIAKKDVHICEEYTMNEEFLMNYAENGKQIMILDFGALVCVAGKE